MGYIVQRNSKYCPNCPMRCGLSRAAQNEEPLGSDHVVAADFNPPKCYATIERRRLGTYFFISNFQGVLFII